MNSNFVEKEVIARKWLCNNVMKSLLSPFTIVDYTHLNQVGGTQEGGSL